MSSERECCVVRWFGVLIWIVEAIGSAELDIRPFLLPFRSHVFLASCGCEPADIIYILGRCPVYYQRIALLRSGGG